MPSRRLTRFGQDASRLERLLYRLPIVTRWTRLYRERAARRDAIARQEHRPRR